MDKREQNKERKRKSRANKTDKEDSHTPVTRDGDVTKGDGSDGHGATEQNLTIPNHIITTTMDEVAEAVLQVAVTSEPLKPEEINYRTLEDAYCSLHQILPLNMRQSDVMSIQETIKDGIPPQFSITVMGDMYETKKQRENKRFKKPSSFSYYLSAIKASWETRQLAQSGGGSSVEKASSTGRPYGSDTRSGRRTSISSDEIDEFASA